MRWAWLLAFSFSEEWNQAGGVVEEAEGRPLLGSLAEWQWSQEGEPRQR